MKTSDAKKFIRKSKVTYDELVEVIRYTRPSISRALTKEGDLGDRFKMTLMMGVKKCLTKKISFYEKALKEWEKMIDDDLSKDT
jgi:DNA-binding transcriptional ArsR family regulator